MQTLAYLDNAATTPLDPRALDAMLPWLREGCGNPSSLHRAGRAARAAVENARRQVAELIGAEPAELVFTGSGTEADNLALRGALERGSAGDRHLVTSAVEHPAILETCSRLERLGCRVTRLPVRSDGIVEPDALVRELRPETRLVSVMAANNVVGTLQPLAELAAASRERGVLFHTDADVDALLEVLPRAVASLRPTAGRAAGAAVPS